ncbi:MAG: VWA domain-containing protein [Marinobacter sp.]|nr:VWA domain-containing protein [Marinobacter sp.]
MLAELHFLRPGWLALLALLPLLPWLLRQAQQSQHGWRGIIAEDLLQPLIPGHNHAHQRRRAPGWLLPALLLSCLSLALAGPAWREADVPLHQQQDRLVIALDMSLSMLATDAAPNRLTQATRKIRDILAARQEGFTALVVYAGDAHVVTPLTDDRQTIENLLPALDPIIMPATGNRADLAVATAIRLLDQSGPGAGRILLISDNVTDADQQAISSLLQERSHTLSTLAVGTPDGAPIPLAERGFIRDQGQVVIARANPAALAELAQRSGGRSHIATLDDTDVRALRLGTDRGAGWQAVEQDLQAARWLDEGYWLLWPVLLLLLWRWQAGRLLALAPLVMLPLYPNTAMALSWSELWSREDQRAPALIEQDPARAAAQLRDPAWRGTALYRQGRFEDAITAFSEDSRPSARYNQANALALTGRLEEALAAYDDVLAAYPHHDDAQHNRELVQQLLDQQQQQPADGEGEGQDASSQDDGSDNAGQSQPQPGQDEDAQAGDREQSPSSPEQADPSRDSDQQQQEDATPGQQPEGSDESDPSREAPAQTLPQQPDTSPLDATQEQWLRRIPDEPGLLLQRKFLEQYRERGTPQREGDTPW